MKKKDKYVHPYIPNSSAETREKMLEEIGIESIDELYSDIPEKLRFRGEMNLPQPLEQEYLLKKHVEKILSKNKTCNENISFLGGGCWQHYVPAVCDVINQRSEFLTAYAGEPYEDHGRFQALFEYASLMGELVEMDVVNVPTFDWAQAASTSIRMAARITDRSEVIVLNRISPNKMSVVLNYCKPAIKVTEMTYNDETGLIDLDELKEKISSKTAAIYFENPSFFGCIENRGKEISDIAHKHGALSIVGVDPISLGILNPPSRYGADIVCGELQPLGIHMQYGGGLAGFIATRDEKRFVMEYPSRLFGITETSQKGEYGFGDVAYERTSFAKREKGKEFVGTAAALWGITAGVYLSLLGPKGMQEVGKCILQKTQYAMKKLSQIKNVKVPSYDTSHFKDFTVDFRRTGKTIKEINKCLLERNIMGGKSMAEDFFNLEEVALYGVTEVHTKEDIDKLADALNDILGN